MQHADPDPSARHREAFLQRLNELDQPPSWAAAATLGVELVDFDRERLALSAELDDLRTARAGLADSVDAGLRTAIETDIATREQRLTEIVDIPGRYYLANGETVAVTDTDGAARIGWWFDDRSFSIRTGDMERFHMPGVHPDAAIHPTAQVDPTARVERGATIGPRARICAYAHIGREAVVAANSVIGDGAWVGPYAELHPRVWISQGATVGARSLIGANSTIASGARIEQGTHLDPHSRTGPGTSTATSSTTPHRGVQIASTIERMMALDRE